MAHPYTTRAELRMMIDARGISALADRDLDGTEDAGVIDGAIKEACRLIDLRLGFAYPTPFASTDGLADDGGIVLVANLISLAALLLNVDGVWRKTLLDEAEALLAAIAEKRAFINAAPIAATTRRRISYQAGTPFVAGNHCNDYSSRGVRRSRGI